MAPTTAAPRRRRGAALPSPYEDFTRAAWAKLRAQTPLSLGDDELAALCGPDEPVSLREVAEVYLPVSRLLHLRVAAWQALQRAGDTFLGGPPRDAPIVIGLAGSVAVGTSTTARILRALLARWPDHPRVELVTTDGFLLPNRVLRARGLQERKGFPESYDLRGLLRFLAELKAGAAEVRAPRYSHLRYDVVPGEAQVLRRPDVVIVEGLNVLQTRAPERGRTPPWFVSDYFDFSVYVDAPVRLLRRWYVARFLALRETALRDPASFFRRFAALSKAEAARFARGVWRSINEVNLRENIEPTRHRASLVLEKGEDHAVRRVRLRRF